MVIMKLVKLRYTFTGIWKDHSHTMGAGSQIKEKWLSCIVRGTSRELNRCLGECLMRTSQSYPCDVLLHNLTKFAIVYQTGSKLVVACYFFIFIFLNLPLWLLKNIKSCTKFLKHNFHECFSRFRQFSMNVNLKIYFKDVEESVRLLSCTLHKWVLGLHRSSVFRVLLWVLIKMI